jgi:hypothetical protein
MKKLKTAADLNIKELAEVTKGKKVAEKRAKEEIRL